MLTPNGASVATTYAAHFEIYRLHDRQAPGTPPRQLSVETSASEFAGFRLTETAQVFGTKFQARHYDADPSM